MCMAQIPAAPLIYANAPPKFFSKVKFIKSLEFFGKPFQQISTLVPNLTMKFNKICGEILIVKSTNHKISEMLSCVKIYSLGLKISSI